MKKRPIVRIALGAAAVLLGLVIAPALAASAASAAPLGGGSTYVCAGGNVPPGTYSSMLITGVCFAPAGTIVIRGNLAIARNALLDAVTPGDPPKHPVVPATVLIGGNVTVGQNAVLALGCSPNISCGSPPGISFDRVAGNLTAINSLAVVVHSATIGGSVTVLGGGGGAAGGANSGACFVAPIPAPWSEAPGLVAGGPQYTDFEDSSIGGNLTVIGVQTCWLGSLRNHVGASMTYRNNVTSDPDGMEINNNLMGANMVCTNNDPAVQYGDSGAAPNLVGGVGIGECGFNVVLRNTGPSDKGTAREHITVSVHALNVYFGTHRATVVAALPPVKTESGYTITAVLNDFTLTGHGLTGSGTVNLHKPAGSTGEAVLSTVFRPGSASFIAYDNCNKCRFGGQTGSTTLRFYGTTSGGVTFGTFLVVAGGTGVGLPTLAGWGTFSSAGQPAGTWGLVEYLANT
jgi:hypothetical protein